MLPADRAVPESSKFDHEEKKNGGTDVDADVTTVKRGGKFAFEKEWPGVDTEWMFVHAKAAVRRTFRVAELEDLVRRSGNTMCCRTS